MNSFLLLEKVFCPIYVRFVLLYWNNSSFENITLFLEANMLLLPENMILFLLFKIERRLLSHLGQICLALLKIQQFWKYHAISGGKYTYVPENMNLFLSLEKGFCPIYVRFVLLYRKHSSFVNITLFQEANILVLSENMILFLLVKRERRLLSHSCQFCLSLLKAQQFWKYLTISGGKYPAASRKHDLIFIS